ncbi:hypothetical protein Leryth_012573 [Lithospermum erythrorhizon]|nr:hypothetical protein Leryth_012573 [Lithospermum erythrorhizon]
MGSMGREHARFLIENNATRNLNRTGEAYNNGEATFDSNMVIILAALIFALICALGVNTIVRWVLRCRGRFGLETQEEMAVRLAARGMKKDEMSQIPEVVFKSGQDIVQGAATDCPICLGEFREGEVVRILPICSHGFHVNCIDKWLASHSSCPICRQLLVASVIHV